MTATARPLSPSLLLPCLLALGACAAVGQTPPSAPAAASAAPTTGADTFGGPRAPDRPADPARPDGTVRLEVPQLDDPDAPGVRPGRPVPALLTELHHNAGHLQRCWDARPPGLHSGRVTIHAQIDPEGLVVEQCLTEQTLGDPALLRCANELIAMGRYPKLGDGPSEVIFSLDLGGPAGGAGAPSGS